MKYAPGDDVIILFADLEHHGQVIKHSNGYVMARIHIEPTWDYGSITPRLDPEPTVCVRETNTRHTQPPAQTPKTTNM